MVVSKALTFALLLLTTTSSPMLAQSSACRFDGVAEVSSEAVQAPGFDTVSVFSDPNNFVTLPHGVQAVRLGEIPLNNTLRWTQKPTANWNHEISGLKLVFFQSTSNGRYYARLEGNATEGIAIETTQSVQVWAKIDILDGPGDVVERIGVSYGRPKCGAVNSGAEQISSNPLLYAAQIRLEAGGPGKCISSDVVVQSC